jgi:hypothetical protein
LVFARGYLQKTRKVLNTTYCVPTRLTQIYIYDISNLATKISFLTIQTALCPKWRVKYAMPEMSV